MVRCQGIGGVANGNEFCWIVKKTSVAGTRLNHYRLQKMQSFQDVVSPHRAVSESVSLIRQTLESAAVAKLKYPDYRFTRLVLSRLDWDDADVAVLGALCDTDLSSPVELRSRLFDQQLRLIICAWGLERLFRKDGEGTYHHAIRPRGYDFDADEVIATEMERWRADYRAMKPVQQM